MAFRLYPFGAAHIRAVKKEAKHYHLDWCVVPASGPRFENLTACHLNSVSRRLPPYNCVVEMGRIGLIATEFASAPPTGFFRVGVIAFKCSVREAAGRSGMLNAE